MVMVMMVIVMVSSVDNKRAIWSIIERPAFARNLIIASYRNKRAHDETERHAPVTQIKNLQKTSLQQWKHLHARNQRALSRRLHFIMHSGPSYRWQRGDPVVSTRKIWHWTNCRENREFKLGSEARIYKTTLQQKSKQTRVISLRLSRLDLQSATLSITLYTMRLEHGLILSF